MNQSFNLHKFKPENLKSSDFIFIIGHRNSGKSTLIKDLLFKSQQVSFGRVFHLGEEYNHFYRDFVPSLLIDDDLNKKKTKEIFNEKRQLNQKEGDVDKGSFIVFDDCLYQLEHKKQKYFFKLIQTKELYQTFILLSLQYAVSLQPDIEKKIDYVFIYREQIIKERKKIYEKFGKMIPNFQMFQDIFEQCTEKDYECLVIHLSNLSTNWMDKIYWYKADIHEKVKLCERKWWKESKITHSFKKNKEITENYLKTMNQIEKFDLR